ncbi:MAG TPA: hypothetical protein VFV05_01540 [Methylomirabilota bacterium]|nr:hypothetical protein [Methylomirabilota bacterium]
MSGATSPTAETGRGLLGKNAALASRLGALGARGGAAATALSGLGTPPTDELVHALRDAGREFAALRAEALAIAGAAGLTAPPAEAIASTRQLDAVLRTLVQTLEVEERGAALARVRAEALAVLDQVTALVHRDDPAFAALARCHTRAREVRATLAASSESDPERERVAAAAATAPFTALLALMDGAQALDDDRWAALADAVATTFGRPLAAAATRGRLLRRSSSGRPGSAAAP